MKTSQSINKKQITSREERKMKAIGKTWTKEVLGAISIVIMTVVCFSQTAITAHAENFGYHSATAYLAEKAIRGKELTATAKMNENTEISSAVANVENGNVIHIDETKFVEETDKANDKK